MKTIILLIFSFLYVYAINPMMLPLKGVDVEHIYSNGGEKEKKSLLKEKLLVFAWK